MSENLLQGVWSLASFVVRNGGGEQRRPFGERPVGQLIYTASGHMAVALMKTGRPHFQSADLYGGTDEELRAAFEGFDAYAGTYVVEGEASRVTHHLQVSRMPNLEDSKQVRYFNLAGDELELSTPPFQAKGQEWVGTLTWHRVA